MGTFRDHRKSAEECLAMARAADHQKDKALWLTLAQSWVRLAEHVARAGSPMRSADGDKDARAVHAPE
jgi:putative IMPACT (imprinted ancient) family translation regulator